MDPGYDEYVDDEARQQSVSMQNEQDVRECSNLNWLKVFNPNIVKDNKSLSLGTPFWEEIRPVNGTQAPSNRNCHTATLIDKYMVIFGGKEGDGRKKFTNDVHILDLEKSFWLKSLKIEGNTPVERMGHSACLFADQFIVIYAGWNGIKVLDDVHYLKFNLPSVEMEWQLIKTDSVSPKRQFHTANVIEKEMFVFGGGDGKYWLNELHSFDLVTHKWQLKETKGKPPSGRLQHSSIICNKKLYVFGGEPDRLRQLNDIHVLDLSTWAWMELNPLGASPTARVSSSAQFKGNKIYFFGGFDGASWRNDLFAFNVDDNMWETMITNGAPPKPRCRHTALIHRDEMIIFGGNDCEKSFNDIHSLRLDVKMKVQDTTLVEDLASMMQDQLFCDVTFVVENTKIPAHKAVLAARCEQFKAMFTSELMEASSHEITIHDTKVDVFRTLLQYIYCDRVELTEKTAIDLIIQANKYLLPRLKNLCEQFIAQRLSVKNIIEIINISELHDAKALKECAINFMLNNRAVICETQDISQISKSILVELFKHRK